MRLKETDEEDLQNLPAEDLLLKWVNWHLNSSRASRVENFSANFQVLCILHALHYALGFGRLRSVDAPSESGFVLAGCVG
jgi:hypothetical protein